MTYVVKKIIQRSIKRANIIIGVSLAVLALGGCSAGDTLGNLGLALSNSNSEAQQPKPVAAQQVVQEAPAISFAPVFTQSKRVANQLSAALESEAQVRSIKVVKGGGTKPEYTVRGYLSASPDKRGTKLTYIWDVINSQGKRAHRIKGEQVFSGGRNSKDPWSSIDQAAVRVIASKTTKELASWLPSSGGGAGLVQKASLVSGPLIVSVPSVKGAPGDGSISLSNALRKQLRNRGIKVANVNTKGNFFKIIGIVSLTAPVAGKQNINIEWAIRNPNNSRIGTVSQENVIPAGSLDGPWKQTADAAANAAAESISNFLKNWKKTADASNYAKR